LKLAKEEELRGEAERRGRESRGGMADAEEVIFKILNPKTWAQTLNPEP
jgi:hypothetical protein